MNFSNMNYFNSKFVGWASQNHLLRSMWLKLPCKTRFHIYQRFSLISKDMEKLTEELIDIFEKEPHLAAGLEKKEDVLKFLKKNKLAAISPEFPEIWLQKSAGGETVFNFNGAVLPRLSNEHIDSFQMIFADTFLFSLLFDDNYSAELVERLEGFMCEGPYGYTAENFNVTVKTGDVVIDAGAWIGDFSAYAASRGATAYAFEPTSAIFKELQKTAALNKTLGGGGGIYPINKGLGETECALELFAYNDIKDTGSNTILKTRARSNGFIEKIKITTLDNFAHEQNLKKLDFIKADIEGAERDMLKGARGILKEFAPKLAICTYHLPDDPQVLENLIMEANPKYRVKQMSKKLFAAVS
jgi:FkbM family methyltransferase